MSTLSVEFLLYFLGAVVVHWLLKNRLRNAFLLIISYLFLLSWDWSFPLFLITATLISYFAGKAVGQNEGRRRVLGLSISVISLLGILTIVKYTHIFVQVLGISFFTFQAISYIVDVYRKDVEVENDFVVLALYIGFLPQLICGPIAKAKEQIARFKGERKFDLASFERAAVLAIYGCFMKMVIADRIAIYVNDVFSNTQSASRIGIATAILLYSIQIYCDFAGYSLIAIGMGRCFGIELPVNFKQPYLAHNINDFWKRWHISLTSWFRDYLYIPLGGNRKGTVRTYINILIVFVMSGIWHGAGLTFLFWGLSHGILQVLEKAAKATKRRYGVLTYLLVSLMWVLFRAENLAQAGGIFKGLIINGNGVGFADVLNHGLNIANIGILIVAVLVMTAVDICKYKEVNIIEKIFSMNIFVRWGVLYVLIFSVLIFGIYGAGYEASNFIYVNF